MSENRVALITGANKGIGLQIAKDLASHGLTVLIGSRKYENGEAAAKTIGEKAHAIQLDVTDQSSIAAAAERIRREFGQQRRHRRRLPKRHNIRGAFEVQHAEPVAAELHPFRL
jgi:NAD(P)-dependent dehydrogenase (short-subunit alcohol dehydrogenase family)